MLLKDKNVYKNFFLFIMGVLFSAVAVSVFYSPNDVVTTGSTGLAILINNYIEIDLSLIIFVISSVLLAISFMIFGIEYGSKNILGTIIFPIFIRATSIINRFVSFEGTSLFLLILIGSVLSGIGFGLVKKSGYSLGGFYVLYDLLNHKFKVSVGTASLICNLLVIFLSIFVYGFEKFIYAFIGLYVTITIADRVMIGISRNKAFYIVTRKPREVKEYIINNLGYTVTVLKAKGGYSNKKKKMLLCVIPTTQYVKIKDFIREIDKDAFFLITDSYYTSKKEKIRKIM